MSKRILIVHRYFYPDTPAYAIMLKKIGKKLVDHGYEVDVLTSMPSYYGSAQSGVPSTENLDGMKVHRLTLLPEKNRNMLARGLNSILFALLVFLKILFRKKYDLVTIATTPPVVMSFVVRMVSWIKGSPYLYHCQDIYPEIARGNGDLKSDWLYKTLRSVDRKNNQKALTNVVLSTDMANTLQQERGIEKDRIAIINNFIRISKDEKIQFSFAETGLKDEDFKVVFCGNIGKLQNLDELVEVAKLLQDKEDIKFVFIGEGVERKKLEAQAGELLNRTIFFLGYFDSAKALTALEQSNIGVVSISEPTYKTAYPSKTMTYLNAGIPILAIMNETAELSRFIVDNQLGLIAKPNDLEAVKKQILKAYEQNEFYKTRQQDIKLKAKKEFGEEEILAKWITLFDKLCQH